MIFKMTDDAHANEALVPYSISSPFSVIIPIFLLVIFIGELFPGRVYAVPELPTLGIIATDKEAEPFADLLTAKLSDSGLVQLVEREQMAVIMQELQLASIQKSDSIAIGRMARASALMFIDIADDAVRIRISETQRGELLFQQVFLNSDLPAVCDIVVRHFPALAAKLVSVDQRVYIAVRPVQMPGASQEDTELLKKFRFLLEARLFSTDNIILVERENLVDITDERISVEDKIDDANLAAADYVVRTVAKKTSTEDYHVILKATAVKEQGSQLFSDHFIWGKMDDTVTRLAGEILEFTGQVPGDSTPASLVAEADLQFEIAQRLLNHGDFLGGIRGLEIAFHLHPNPEQIAPQLVKHICRYIRQVSSGQAALSGNHYTETYAQEPVAAYMDWVHWLRVAMVIAEQYAPAAHELKPDGELYPFRFLYSKPKGLSPDQEAALHDCRTEMRAFFEGCQNEAAVLTKNPAVKLFPLFFEDPENAERYMRTEWREDPAFSSLSWKWHPFTKITYWDAEKAREIWFEFLNELIRDGTQAQQYDGLLSEYEDSADQQRFYTRYIVKAAECARNLFGWLNSNSNNLAWLLRNATETSFRDIEFALLELPPIEQNHIFNSVIIPLLMAHPTQRGELYSYLYYRYDQEKKNDSISQELPRLAQAALGALAEQNSAFAQNERQHLESASWYREMMAGYPLGTLPEDLPELEMEHEILLHLVRSTVGNYFECSGILCDDHSVWICWKALTGIEIARMNWAFPRQSPVIFHVLLPPSRSQMSSQSLCVIRWRSYLVVSGLDNVIAIPLDDDQVLHPANAVVLGPQIGDSTIGIRERNVSALVPGPDAIYICLDDWRSAGLGVNAYGGIYRWVPGESGCEKVCASDSLASGPLNDCLPYQVVAGSATADGRGVVLFVAGSADPPSSGAISPQSGAWRYDIEQHALSQLVSTNLGYLKEAGMSPARTSKDEYVFETSKAAYCFNLGANSLQSVVGPPKLRPFVGRFHYRTAVPTTNGWLVFFFKVRDGGDSRGILCHLPNDGE